MAMISLEKRIIATTIDESGADFARKQVLESGLEKQIEIKIEDISKKLPYQNDYFDFIYARLVLHYLNKEELKYTLSELYRVLKKGGRFFIVVRSIDCFEAQHNKSSYNKSTGTITYCSENNETCKRFFHTTDSIKTFLSNANFNIKHVKVYQEHLCIDFKRTKPSKYVDTLIEILAEK
jgi:ubiquinone/menaquinone biosynthesis C-methylase UbiE